MADPITIRSALPAEINKIDIFSNEDPSKSADLRGGLLRLQYYESILQDSVRVILYYADSGNTIDKDGKNIIEKYTSTAGRFLLANVLPKNHNIKFALVNKLLTKKNVS